jgi:predicted metal-binding protein
MDRQKKVHWKEKKSCKKGISFLVALFNGQARLCYIGVPGI